MNIFVLDESINKCAHYHCDKHVVKMILEYAQILSTTCLLTGIKTYYKPTHIKHPCVIWTKQSLQNWRWLKKLLNALNNEYKYRYNKTTDHRSFAVANRLKEPDLPSIGLIEFVQVMPERYKVKNNPIQAYRNYYVGMKSSFACWTRRRTPTWYKTIYGGKK